MFHSVPTDAAQATKWDSVRQLVLDPANNSYIAATARLDGAPFHVPNERLAFRISAFNYISQLTSPPNNYTVAQAGIAMGQDICGLLYSGQGFYLYQPPSNPGVLPGKVIVDALYTNDHTIGVPPNPTVTVTWEQCAELLTWCGAYCYKYVLPYVENRWAVAVQHCQNDRGFSEPLISQALTYIFIGGGITAFEMYANREWYCNNSRDAWLENYFKHGPNGTTATDGFKWVWDTFPAYHNRMKVILGVQDPRFKIPMDSSAPISPTDAPVRFMDRMMYVWKRYAYPTAVARVNGGFGSYQWDAAVTSDSRDLTFAGLWTYWVAQNHTAPQHTVPCPP